MITFKNAGHLFATVYQKALSVIGKAEGTEKTVETATSVAPVYGPLAVTVEKAGYALLGEISAVLNAGGDAAKAKLADAGLDQNVVLTVEAVLKAVPEISALAKAI